MSKRAQAKRRAARSTMQAKAPDAAATVTYRPSTRRRSARPQMDPNLKRRVMAAMVLYARKHADDPEVQALHKVWALKYGRCLSCRQISISKHDLPPTCPHCGADQRVAPVLEHVEAGCTETKPCLHPELRWVHSGTCRLGTSLG